MLGTWEISKLSNCYFENWYCRFSFRDLHVCLYIGADYPLSPYYGEITVEGDDNFWEYSDILKRKMYMRGDIELAKRHMEAVFNKMRMSAEKCQLWNN